MKGAEPRGLTLGGTLGGKQSRTWARSRSSLPPFHPRAPTMQVTLSWHLCPWAGTWRPAQGREGHVSASVQKPSGPPSLTHHSGAGVGFQTGAHFSSPPLPGAPSSCPSTKWLGGALGGCGTLGREVSSPGAEDAAHLSRGRKDAPHGGGHWSPGAGGSSPGGLGAGGLVR